RSTPLLFDTPVPSDGLLAKEPMVLITTYDNRGLLLSTELIEHADLAPLGLSRAAMPPRIEVATPPPGDGVRHGLFHALHALGLDTLNQ
ncbi:MAG: hypothetical protein HOI89_08730, partial [Phycisphaerae bacterium]|nr:hypothetical protein [Phycisphaerae bacterium]